MSLFQECQTWNIPTWDHGFPTKVIMLTTYLLIAPLRAMRQSSQWHFCPPWFFFFFMRQYEGFSIFHHQSNHTKMFFFPSHNIFAICFSLTPVQVLILCLRSLTSYLTPEPVAPLYPWLNLYWILTNWLSSFWEEARKQHCNALPLNSHILCTGRFKLTGDWLCTCDLMIVSVKEVVDGGRDEGGAIGSEGHLGVGDCLPCLLTISQQVILAISLPKMSQSVILPWCKSLWQS